MDGVKMVVLAINNRLEVSGWERESIGKEVEENDRDTPVKLSSGRHMAIFHPKFGWKASCSSSTGGAKQQKANPIFDIVLTANIVKQDLLLLENQIPFFVLEELFKLTVGQIPVENKLSLNDYIILYFHNIFMPPESKNCGSEKKTGGCLGGGCVPWQLCSTEGTARKKANDKRIYHILHLLHNHYRPEREDGSVDQVEVPVDPGENKKLSGEDGSVDQVEVLVDPGENKKLSGEKIPVDQGKNKKLSGDQRGCF